MPDIIKQGAHCELMLCCRPQKKKKIESEVRKPQRHILLLSNKIENNVMIS